MNFKNKVMFHIAGFMNQEQRRRLIANDIALLFYHESQEPFDLKLFSEDMGSFAQIFGVIQRIPDSDNRYRTEFFRRSNLDCDYPPLIPEFYLTISELKDFIFTKGNNFFLFLI